VLIFLDVETTGLEDDDRVCSIGMISVVDDGIKSYYELLNEGKKIHPKASSIHHITNEMLVDKPLFKDSNIYKFLESNNTLDSTIIGHNIQHTMQKLLEVGFIFKGALIDTLRVSKHIIKECESYALQFLRYELRLYKNENSELKRLYLSSPIISHHALYDSLLVRLLYLYLLEEVSHEKMCELSFESVLIEKFEFGKHSGRYLEDVAINDRSYLEWMASNMDLDDDLRYSIDYYLKG